MESILQGTGLVHETLYFRAGLGKLSYSIALARDLRKLNADKLVYLAPRTTALQVYRDLLFFKAAGIGIGDIIGAPIGIGARECRCDPITGELEHEAERLARMLSPAILVDLHKPSWDLCLSASEQKIATERLSGLRGWSRPVLALSPGARIPAKDWGEERWEALVALLQARVPATSLVFVGAPDERALADRVARRWTGVKLNLCGDLTPRESAAVLAKCDLFVCHDSGPMHLAASQGTPCLALFGNFNKPRQWYPFGCAHVVIYDAQGLRNISVERVADAVEVAVHSLWDSVERKLRTGGAVT